jgi:hypothetical protein
MIDALPMFTVVLPEDCLAFHENRHLWQYWQQ